MNADALYKKVIRSAAQHGRDSEPDHEVGDLQDILYDALQALERAGALPDLIDTLASTIGRDQIEYDWLADINREEATHTVELDGSKQTNRKQ